ncbi:phosphoribosylanthranilate isomerase [Sulfuriflexus mobilis]|uniref:phosphoribosylanthranilate isomerase n=1 Tax=Sulfuriflexus mobilis TaxID=1811807 RepID=UPI000F81CA5D|nr:phosphoribosylanthranilate isomerase [Sulfuriflexus mobilis]
MPIRTKICGITRPQDGLAAARAGADAIGLVFYPKSPRAVTIEQAAEICAALPPFVTAVGLFVDAEHFSIDDVLRGVPLDLLQFHGSETPAQCEAFDTPYIKAIRMSEEADLVEAASHYGSARGLLVDTWSPTEAGGTGEAFDWDRVSPAMRGELETPIILAGGLHPGNVAGAIAAVQPYAVDVSSGVEASKGIKDADKITAFMQAVRQADRT